MQMLDAVRRGESELCKATVPSGPLLATIARFHQEPTQRTLLDFLTLAKTDLNRRISQEFTRLLNAEYTFVQDEKLGKYQFPTLRGMIVGE